MKTIERRSDCPISYTLDFLGDKWSLLILRDMMFYHKSSYGDFKCSGEKIASNILVDRLKVLHGTGFITKRPAPLNKSKFLYALTEKSIELVPLLMDLIVWGSKYNPDGGPEDILDQLSANRNNTIMKLQQKLRSERDESLKENNQPDIPPISVVA